MDDQTNSPSPPSSPSSANGHSKPPTSTSPNISWPLNRPSSLGPFNERIHQALRARHTESSNSAQDSTFIVHSTSPALPFKSAISLDPDLLPGRSKSLSGISFQAFLLGSTFTLGLLLTLYLLLLTTPSVPYAPLWRASLFLSILSIYHFLEFYTTARWNTIRVLASSFLLTGNGAAYFTAQAAAFIEIFVVTYFYPGGGNAVPIPWAWFRTPTLLALGATLVVIGQGIRSLGMAHLGTNFNHIVQIRRNAEHELVTTGVYAWLRHPAYFGFFWWAVGTQIVLGNAVCAGLYVWVLWKFFRHRIRREEKALLDFFGDEYAVYEKKTAIGIPFVLYATDWLTNPLLPLQPANHSSPLPLPESPSIVFTVHSLNSRAVNDRPPTPSGVLALLLTQFIQAHPINPSGDPPSGLPATFLTLPPLPELAALTILPLLDGCCLVGLAEEDAHGVSATGAQMGVDSDVAAVCEMRVGVGTHLDPEKERSTGGWLKRWLVPGGLDDSGCGNPCRTKIHRIRFCSV
ncbi:MAG: hypothetical protein M1820_009164 [Bogoriella megaspora]|nr:MAG: hypothetical protein M1820_009164 [Bogoriella megaspora]